MQIKKICLIAVLLLIAAACRQADAVPNPAVKTTKLITVTGIQLQPLSSPPKFKLPVFQNTKFSFASSCNHCVDAFLTVKANAKGAPVITYVGALQDPWFYGATVTITTSPPTITVVEPTSENPPREAYRFTANITALYREDVSFAWTRRAAIDSLNTVATNAAGFTVFKQHYSGNPFPYSPNMRLVVAYLKHLAVAAKGWRA